MNPATLDRARARLWVGLLVVAAALVGCWFHSIAAPFTLTVTGHVGVPHVVTDTGMAARYDRCTYNAFIHHTSPTVCYRYAPGVQP